MKVSRYIIAAIVFVILMVLCAILGLVFVCAPTLAGNANKPLYITMFALAAVSAGGFAYCLNEEADRNMASIHPGLYVSSRPSISDSSQTETYIQTQPSYIASPAHKTRMAWGEDSNEESNSSIPSSQFTPVM